MIACCITSGEVRAGERTTEGKRRHKPWRANEECVDEDGCIAKKVENDAFPRIDGLASFPKKAWRQKGRARKIRKNRAWHKAAEAADDGDMGDQIAAGSGKRRRKPDNDGGTERQPQKRKVEKIKKTVTATSSGCKVERRGQIRQRKQPEKLKWTRQNTDISRKFEKEDRARKVYRQNHVAEKN